MIINKLNYKKIYQAKKLSVETMEHKGYKLIEELFVDSSGFGGPNEPALTIEKFEKRLIELLDQHGELNATITGAGQFQVYVGLFKKEGVKKSKIVDANTLEIIDGDKRIIRLYDTNIITFLNNGRIILNTGGFNTRTTTDRMNKFLTDGWVYRKNWELFYKNSKGKNYKFENDTLII